MRNKTETPYEAAKRRHGSDFVYDPEKVPDLPAGKDYKPRPMTDQEKKDLDHFLSEQHRVVREARAKLKKADLERLNAPIYNHVKKS